MSGGWAGVAAVAAVMVVHVDVPISPSAEAVPLVSTAFGDSASEVRADFNGDGFSDLVIGLDWSVRIAYGSSVGLTARTQLVPDTKIGGPVTDGLESRGAGHEVGDFNGDGFSDLAIGIFQHDVGRVNQAGAVYVFSGSPEGLDPSHRQVWTQATPGIAGEPEDIDYFGAALAAGDFDGSGHDDLAIGVQYESVNGVSEAGSVQVIPGSSSGLTAIGSQVLTQASPGVPGRLGGNVFGSALAAGDFRGSGYDDLVVGVPAEQVNGHRFAGAIVVLSGGPAGISGRGSQRWSQDSLGIHGVAENYDMFGGGALVAGRFTNTAFDSLAIGVPDESIGKKKSAGAVHVLYGSAHGLTAAGNQMWHEGRAGISGRPTKDEIFGLGLAAANFGTSHDGRRLDSLAIGVPRGGPHGAGAVHVLHSTGERLTARGSEYWSQASPGVAGRAQRWDEFGLAIAAADFGNGPYADLVIGAPSEAVGPDEVSVGQFHVLYGASRGLSSRGSQVWSSLDYELDPEEGLTSLGYSFEAG